MTYALVWIVLWLKTGAPELHGAVVIGAPCSEDVAQTVHDEIVAKSDHRDALSRAYSWGCDQAPTPDVPDIMPPDHEHIPGKGET